MAESRALIQFSQEERTLLRKTIAPGTTDDQFDLFIQVCKQTGLNPFARQIYAVVRREKQKNGTYESKMTIQTSIDGYRLLAQRSNEYAGQEGPYWYDVESKEWVEVWLSDTPPPAAKVGVMRRGFVKPIYAVARFESYAVRAYNEQTRKYDGSLLNLWAKMPELMIAKVAEALALRRAFPAELSGIYTDEEMLQADRPMPTVVIEPEPVTGEVVEADPPAQSEPHILHPSNNIFQQVEVLLEDVPTFLPNWCKQNPKWRTIVLHNALGEPLPKGDEYTEDHRVRVELEIARLRNEKAKKAS